MTSMKTALETARPDGLVAPGVYDGLTAILAEEAGFPAAYLSGASLSYTSYGQPDTGYTALPDVESATRRISAQLSIPLVVDADHGFGSPANVETTVTRLEAAGAAAIQIEDQSFPKKCGHLRGKAVIPPIEMGAKVVAAVEARRNEDTWIIARTDALAIEGFDAAVERAEFYLACGADALFIEALRDAADMERIAERFADRVPLVANMVDGGRTPLLSVAELNRMGFALTLFPGGTPRAVVRALREYFTALNQSGDIRTVADRLAGFDALNALLGLPDNAAREEALQERMELLWQEATSSS